MKAFSDLAMASYLFNAFFIMRPMDREPILCQSSQCCGGVRQHSRSSACTFRWSLWKVPSHSDILWSFLQSCPWSLQADYNSNRNCLIYVTSDYPMKQRTNLHTIKFLGAIFVRKTHDPKRNNIETFRFNDSKIKWLKVSDLPTSWHHRQHLCCLIFCYLHCRKCEKERKNNS